MLNYELWLILFLFCYIIYHIKKINGTSPFIIYRIRKQKKCYDERFTPANNDKPYINTNLSRLNHTLRKYDNVYSTSKGICHSVDNPKQRSYGYCRLYDEAAALFSIILDCEPITFQYKKKQWLIEFWKGQYGSALGAEVGIFCSKNKTIHVPQLFSGIFYDAMDLKNYIPIEIICRRNGTLLFVAIGIHYLVNGFMIGEFAAPADLSLDITLTFPCFGMRNAFLRGLRRAGYSSKEYRIHKKKVCVFFHTPHTTQPLSKILLQEYKLLTCKSLCALFSEITPDEKDTVMKLLSLKKNNPALFHKLIEIGKTNAMYHSVYQYLKPFI